MICNQCGNAILHTCGPACAVCLKTGRGTLESARNAMDDFVKNMAEKYPLNRISSVFDPLPLTASEQQELNGLRRQFEAAQQMHRELSNDLLLKAEASALDAAMNALQPRERTAEEITKGFSA